MQHQPLNHQLQPVTQQSPPQEPKVVKLVTEEEVTQLLFSKKERKITETRTRDIIKNVLQVCRAEDTKNKLLLRIYSTICNRITYYTGLNGRLIYKILKNMKEGTDTERPAWKFRQYKVVLDDRDIIIIKNLIRDHYLKYHNFPRLQALAIFASDQIPTYKSTGIQCMINILKHLGYRRKRYYSKERVLVESPSIIALRDKYLNRIRELRQNFENVFYIYEGVIDKSYTLFKSWIQKYGCNDTLNDKCTFTFICVVSVNGFLTDTTMLIKTIHNQNIRQGSGQMTHATFENWLLEFLIPHLPMNSTIIMDDAPHHCIESEKTLQYYVSKSEMCKFLNSKGIECDIKWRRSQLFKMVRQYTPTDKVYVLDTLLREYGHETLRLPPYMVHLNLAQHAMDKIQEKLFEVNHEGEFNVENVIEIMAYAMSFVTEEDFGLFNEKVANLEEECRAKDEQFEEVFDKVLLNLRDSAENGENSEGSDF